MSALPPIIWTRSLKDWSEDRKLFSELALEVLHIPCIATLALPATRNLPIPGTERSKSFQGIFSSAKTLVYLRDQKQMLDLFRNHSDNYGFAPQTVQGARDLGIPIVLVEAMTGLKDLAIYLETRLDPRRPLLLPGGKERAYDVQAHFAAKGFICHRWDLYQTQKAAHHHQGRPLTQNEISKIGNDFKGAVCFASPSAVEGFINTFSPSELPLSTIATAIAIGPTTAKTCRLYFKNVISAPAPNSNSLIKTALSQVGL